jgi:hypothetical protein
VNTYAVSMDCPHATRPDVCWSVALLEERSHGTWVASTLEGQRQLWVPGLETWTVDTLRMVLHELAAFLPAHDAAEAVIKATPKRRSGRAARSRLPPRLDQSSVEFWLQARGWRVNVWAWTNDRPVAEGDPRSWPNDWSEPVAGDWSVPMAATLLDLAAKSPFLLSFVAPVPAGPAAAWGLAPSRTATLRASERPRAFSRHVDPSLAGPLGTVER